MVTTFLPAADRYQEMQYRRTGRSGLLLPVVSLGLWHNFGGDRSLETQREIIRRAFDLGITHFELANNYGPPYGSAEENFGRILDSDLRPYRDELIISTKAGYDMWPGPYGEWGSKKYRFLLRHGRCPDGGGVQRGRLDRTERRLVVQLTVLRSCLYIGVRGGNVRRLRRGDELAELPDNRSWHRHLPGHRAVPPVGRWKSPGGRRTETDP